MRFTDHDRIAEWARDAVYTAVALGLLRGDAEGTFRPQDPVTRQEFAVALVNLARAAGKLDSFDLRDSLRRVADTVVTVRVLGAGLGSGVVIAPGRVLTNAHVVGDAAQVEIVFSSPFRRQGLPSFVGPMCRVVARDPEQDLALIAVPESISTVTATLAPGWEDDDTVTRQHYGETLIIQGSPVGLSGYISVGQFAGIRYTAGNTYLHLNTHVNPGNSGGPIWDSDGRLVGIVVAKFVHEALEGLGLGIPLSRIIPFLAANGVVTAA